MGSLEKGCSMTIIIDMCTETAVGRCACLGAATTQPRHAEHSCCQSFALGSNTVQTTLWVSHHANRSTSLWRCYRYEKDAVWRSTHLHFQGVLWSQTFPLTWSQCLTCLHSYCKAFCTHCSWQAMKSLHCYEIVIEMGSSALAAAVPYAGKAVWNSCKGQWSNKI